MTTCLVSLLLLWGALVGLDWFYFKKFLIHEMKEAGRLAAQFSAAPLEFQDHQAAREVLEALQTDPRILAAAIYDRKGALFASLSPSQAEGSLMGGSPETTDHVQEDALNLFFPIRVGQETLGTLEISYYSQFMEDKVWVFALAGSGVLVLSLGVAFFLSDRLQRKISGPILELRHAAKNISDKMDYSVRVSAPDPDEIGFLVDQFNEMLKQIKEREQELRQAQETLEARVQERTRKLQEEIEVRKEMESLLREAKETAEEASRWKTEFLSRMSHELRTPLNAILGFSEILENFSEDPLTPAQLENVRNINRGGKHLLELINEALDIVKIEKSKVDLNLQPLHLNPFLDQIMNFARPLGQFKNVEFRSQVLSDPPLWVMADQTRLKQIILNLFSNAVKYHREGGRVVISCGKTTDRMGAVFIQDSDMGIPAEKLNLVFQPFSRFGMELNEDEGTGLGMTLVKNLMEMMGGTIHLESKEEGGTLITLELPLADGDPFSPETE